MKNCGKRFAPYAPLRSGERANRAQAGCQQIPLSLWLIMSNRICFVRDSVVRAGSAYCVDTQNKAPATAAAKIPVILNDSTTWLSFCSLIEHPPLLF